MRKKSPVPYIRIVLLGSGNMATQLGIALRQCGFHITQIYSPNLKHAKVLARAVKAKPVSILSQLDETADMYILAVKDDIIEKLVKRLHLKDKLLVHTSGSVGQDVLRPASSSTGVLYPLQTLSIERKIVWQHIPICIEANTKSGKILLEKIAGRLSERVVPLNSQARKQLHLAAVFASNFSNHMYTIAEQLLKKNKLSYRLLAPLIMETAQKAMEMGPTAAQTGPALRADQKTMKKHLKMLSENKAYHDLYLAISRSIRKK
ncbi:MAG: Rossmann-like and DUF2520 domain-containing protein [Bacteroidia bacterium]